MTNRLSEYGEVIGLRINCDKTKTMSVEQSLQPPLKIGQQNVEHVDHFQYLGSCISKDGDATADVRAKIGKAASVFQRLRSIWSSKNISKVVKLRLYTSIVLPTASNAGETRKTSAEIANKLDVFHRRCLSTILGISWREHICNGEVMKRAQIENLHDIIQKRRCKFCRSYSTPIQQERPAFMAMTWVSEEGKRKKGRPKKTWRSTFQEDLKEKRVRWNGVRRVASDRCRWRSLVAQCSS